MPNAEFLTQIDQETATLQTSRRLSVIEAIAFKQHCLQILEHKPQIQVFIVDFQHTQFIDSSGIGALVNVWKVSKAHNLEFCLSNVAAQVMMALSLAGL